MILASEEQYAALTEKDGFYLGVLDMCVMAIERGKDLAFLYWDDEFPEGNPAIRSAIQVMESFVPDHVFWDGPKELDLTSLDTWLLGCCRSDFRRATFRQLNHFIPLFSQGQCGGFGESFWTDRTTGAANKISKGLTKAMKRLEDEGDSDDDAWAATLKEHLELLEQKRVFLETLHKMGMHPEEVPADGNCALWSLLVLQGGPEMRDFTKNESHVEAMRKASSLEVHDSSFLIPFLF